MPAEHKSKIAPVVYSRDQHSVSRNDIDSDALKILYRLLRHGYKAYMVGGGVRDLLLGKQPKDFDIATDATPNQVRSIFRNCRIIGRRFKLAHVYFQGGKIIEVSTFRDISDPVDVQDDDEDGTRHGMPLRDNRYGTAETDALRRDITINGLFYDLATFSVIDYVNGMDDLKSRIVRIIGEPNSRIVEDPVRLLRVVRHAARAGFDIEEHCQTALRHNAHLIETCPPMRVYEELKKDLCSGYCHEILWLLGRYNILGHVLPELVEEKGSTLLDTTELGYTLQRLDEMARDKRTSASASVSLSVIALFSIAGVDTVAALSEELSERVRISDGIQRCFSHLAVPKKERLKIRDLLFMWHRCVSGKPVRFRSGSALQQSLWPELVILMRCLGQEIPEEEAVEGRPPTRVSGGRRRGRRRRPHSGRNPQQHGATR